MTAAKKKKKPKIVKEPQPEKRPSRRAVDPGYDSYTPVWRIGQMDIGGPWCWKAIDHSTWWSTIFERLKALESATWAEIKSAGSHNIEIEKLIPSAVKRLQEINQDDLDELFSLRIDARKRIWGVKRGRTLRLLWWDPEHQICPAPKKHT